MEYKVVPACQAEFSPQGEAVVSACQEGRTAIPGQRPDTSSAGGASHRK